MLASLHPRRLTFLPSVSGCMVVSALFPAPSAHAMGHLFVSRRASSVWRPRGSTAPSVDAAAEKAKRRDYVAVLRCNPQFALAFAGEVVSQAGNWFAYMAQLVLVQRFGGGSSKAVAGLLLCRLLPATLLAAPLGALADKVEKRKGLAACSVAAGGCSALMCACRVPAALPLLYVLLALQAAAVRRRAGQQRWRRPRRGTPDLKPVRHLMSNFCASFGALYLAPSSSRHGASGRCRCRAVAGHSAAACAALGARLGGGVWGVGGAGQASAGPCAPRGRGG